MKNLKLITLLTIVTIGYSCSKPEDTPQPVEDPTEVINNVQPTPPVVTPVDSSSLSVNLVNRWSTDSTILIYRDSATGVEFDRLSIYPNSSGPQLGIAYTLDTAYQQTDGIINYLTGVTYTDNGDSTVTHHSFPISTDYKINALTTTNLERQTVSTTTNLTVHPNAYTVTSINWYTKL